MSSETSTRLTGTTTGAGPRPGGGLLRNIARTVRLLMRASATLLVGAMVCQLVDAGTSVLIAYVAKQLVDAVVTTVQGGTAQPLLWVVIEGGLVLARMLSTYGAEYIQVVLRSRFALFASQMVLQKACRIAYPHFENADFNNQIKQVRQEVGGRAIELTTQAMALVRHGLTVIGYAVLLWSLGPWAVGALIAIALPPFLVEVWYGRLSFELQRENIERTRRSFYLEWLLTAEQNVKEIKLLGLGPWLLGRHREVNEKYNTEEAALARQRGIRAVLFSMLGHAGLYAMYIYIVQQAATGAITLGSMTLYLMVLRQGQLSLNSALLALARAYEHNLFMTQLFEYLAMPSEDLDEGFEQSRAQVHAPATIEFRDVSFRYPGAHRDALRNVSLTIRPGETLALIGPNGSGKTTFVKLLAGLHRASAGCILLDGVDIATLDPGYMRRRIGLIFQDFVRFHLSAGENVGVGWLPSIDDGTAIDRALADAEASKVVDSLPAGKATPLGLSFGGLDLSGGQWQRLALARAFMHRGGVLVLDEPTAALDPDAEMEIFQRIHDNKDQRTIVLISHRLSSVRMANQIVVFENGGIVEHGSHSELLARNGRYARMFRDQAEGYHLDEAR